MKIENDTLVIDESLMDEQIEEFLVAINQEEIQKISIQTEDVSASIIQAIWCSKKNVEVDSEFLSKFFENVKVVE